jgi:hypothetical protein
LNLAISSSYWVDLLDEINNDEKWGTTRVTENSPLVMVEYS